MSSLLNALSCFVFDSNGCMKFWIQYTNWSNKPPGLFTLITVKGKGFCHFKNIMFQAFLTTKWICTLKHKGNHKEYFSRNNKHNARPIRLTFPKVLTEMTDRDKESMNHYFHMWMFCLLAKPFVSQQISWYFELVCFSTRINIIFNQQCILLIPWAFFSLSDICTKENPKNVGLSRIVTKVRVKVQQLYMSCKTTLMSVMFHCSQQPLFSCKGPPTPRWLFADVGYRFVMM